MSCRKMTLRIGFLTLVVLLLAGCGGSPAEPTLAQPAVAATQIPPTEAFSTVPATSTPIPATSTPTVPPATPTDAPPVFTVTISLASEVPDWAAGKMMLGVLDGDYRLKSGATARAGSLIYVFEGDMTFPQGMGINVGAGGVSLRGTSYPEGTLLYISAGGELTVLE